MAMIAIPEHKILAKIYESANSIVYRGRRELDDQPVILKLLKLDYPTPVELTKYKQEYEITHSLNIEGVVRAYKLCKYNNTLVMFLEDFGGESLKIWMNAKKLNLEEFLFLAIRITEILGEIHQKNIIHKDINPSNIIFNPITGQLKIIDFGLATRFPREDSAIKNSNVLEGSLAYISPEQTGRMNRTVDYRSDFYSLGVTFFELLTHQLPFKVSDAMELVHSHIAKYPVPPHKINLEIPEIVSSIVMKLLAKTAENRYQSTYGIKFDLQSCLTSLRNTNRILEFPLARQDVSEKFQIPQKLYGREKEIEILIMAFKRVGKRVSGGIEMLLVTGDSGIGKSALVKEIYKPITQKRGYFISGKFEQFQRNIPYLAVVRAFQSLVRQLLSESAAQLSLWREKLSDALGSNGQIIIDVIPEVELIVGTQPSIQQLDTGEFQTRFNFVFKKFIHVFCQQSHPLVIFLDDLQWADSASLKLIELLMTDTNIQYLFLIGAYRNNEVSPIHSLILTLDTLKEKGAIVSQIKLGALNIVQIAQLIADTLNQDVSTVKPLAEMVLQKTEGNPFFINEFLKTLYQENLLVFDFQKGYWQCNIEQVKKMNITDNVVELMIAKLKKLPESTQQVLRLAACVGNSFDLTTLSIINEKSAVETFTDLLPAIQQGLVLPTSELEPVDSKGIDYQMLILNHKFLHDRVQQAAYALIDDDKKKAVHLKIGRLLLNNTSLEERAEKIFDLVAHLNQGWDLIQNNKQEKLQLAQLNLEAGQKAKDATAYASAREYLTVGQNTLNVNHWEENYELAFTIYKELAEVEYLNGNFEKSEELTDFALDKAKSVMDKVELYKTLIVQYATSARYQDAMKIGRKCLAMLGIELPESDWKTALVGEMAKSNEYLKGIKIASLIDLPEMKVPEIIAALKILDSIDSTTYLLSIDLYALVAAKRVNLCLTYGNLPESAKAYVDYGVAVNAILGDYTSAYDFGLLAMNLSEKFNSQEQKCKASLLLGYWLNSWVHPIKDAALIHIEGYKAGLKSGELLYAGYNLAYVSLNKFSQGVNLEKVLEEIPHFLLFCENTKNKLIVELILGFHLNIFNLTGRSKEKLDFQNELISEVQYLSSSELQLNSASLCCYHIFKCQVLYLYGEYAMAFDCAFKAEELLYSIQGQYLVSEQNFYFSLILAALYPVVSESKKKQYWNKLEANQKQMRIWADNCSENFLHKYFLVAAEMCRLAGNDIEAIDFYEQAIESARKNEFIQNEALSNELAAKFWLNKGMEKIAKLYIREAHYGYELWGAKRKVENLEDQYPHLLSEVTQTKAGLQTTIGITNPSSGGTNTGILDLMTVVKASQALTCEIVLDKLLEKLMKIAIENAGAQKGFLILEKEGNWVIEAEGLVNSDDVTTLQSILVDVDTACQIPLLSIAIINYVIHTQENVVLNDAAREGQFTRDTYIVSNRPKSILCTPLLHQGKLNGILYLENNLTTGAFTTERVEILRILSAQAAISIENSRLYEQLEDYSRTLKQKVEARTQELQEKNEELRATLQELKATQTQIIAQEKLASLGALTAGIAHEIKNPLNFVNNFAELSVELTQELLEELETQKEQLDSKIRESIEEILSALSQNAQKINEHGKRADNIVRGMLMHSGGHPGERQLTDINALLAESVNLAYHGMRVKEPSFNITIETHYEHNLSKLNVVPQNISRVFLNVINNACYAAHEKKVCFLAESKGEEFLPKLSISTKDLGEKVEIRIRDNGKGIPQKVLDKVFNPFFTTKPTGQGTGLGLSISHDLIVQEHQGEIRVETKMGVYTEFIISLPKLANSKELNK